MHEILRNLSSDSLVLDLGCGSSSFSESETFGTVIRVDREPPRRRAVLNFVQGDAARLPFPDETFAAVISNHSLEHFDNLDNALSEIGRVLRRDGSLFIAVPDSSTVTDRLYRWLAKGGGHVNGFTSAAELALRIERATGLPHAGTRLLYSSLSFLNSKRSPPPAAPPDASRRRRRVVPIPVFLDFPADRSSARHANQCLRLGSLFWPNGWFVRHAGLAKCLYPVRQRRTCFRSHCRIARSFGVSGSAGL